MRCKWAWHEQEKLKMRKKFRSEILKGRYQFEALDVQAMIILKWVLNRIKECDSIYLG